MFIGLGLGSKTPAGIHRNTLEVLKELDKIITNNQCEVLIPVNETIDYSFTNIKVIQIGNVNSRWSRFVWKNVIIQKYLRKKNAVSIDLLLVFPIKVSDIISLYDCIPEYTPENYKSLKQKFKRWKLIKIQKRQLKKCKKIITDSNYAKNQIIEFYHIPEDKINVVYCSWQHFLRITEDDKILERLGLGKYQYYFSLGSRFPHKNVKWITKAAEKNPNEQFIVSGQYSSFVDTSFEGEIPSNMKFCGYLSDQEVKSLMHYCKAFIQPSFFEGFGIPPMEAMSVGANCIVSNRASLPEVYKDSVWYIEPDDYENIDFGKIMATPKQSNKSILDAYSWEKSAKELLKYISELP